MDFSISLVLNAVYLLIFAQLFYKATKWLINYVRLLSVVNKFEGYPMLPIIGNAHQIGRKHEFFSQIRQISELYEKEPIFRIWIGWNPIIVFHRADHIDVLVSSSKNSQKSSEYRYIEPWLGTGLLTSYGDKWTNRRRLITPAFHFDILNDFLVVMNEQSAIFVDILEKLSKKGETIDMFRRSALCALDIICETAMGCNVNAQVDVDSEYVQAIATISETIFERFTSPLCWPDFLFKRLKHGRDHDRALKILHGFTKSVIRERHAEFDGSNVNNSSKRVAFLDMLLKAKSLDPSITFDDIQEEVDTFMFEGHDTTATAAGWACQMIGSHPEVQKKLHEEIDEVFQGSTRHITNDDLSKLKYLECVIKETLRLFPSVPFFGRTITEDSVVDGRVIPAGCTAVILCFMIHRDEKYYPDPERFDPERFTLENSKDRHAYAYIPFSAGKRNCIGQRFAMMEEKVILANILRKFEIQAQQTIDEIQPVAELILRPVNGIPVKLIPRI